MQMARLMHHRCGGGNVRNRRLNNLAVGFTLAIFTAACSSARGNEETGDGATGGSGDTVTIAGCLSGTQDGRFALTAAPDATGAAAGRAVAGDERETHSYILTGGDNLQQHVGKRVEVTGTVSGSERQVEHDAEKKTDVPNATGGSEQPQVKTTEEVEVAVRNLQVREVRPVAGECTLTR
jgi:hypothetical protein